MLIKHLKVFFCLGFLFSFFLGHAADYYWVGGSGNWSDLSHWVTTSGGNTGHVQVPTADDDVIFDLNSFNGPADILTLNSDNVYFKNMVWDNGIAGVTMTGATDVRMNIYGSLMLSPNMTYAFNGDLVFNSIEPGFQDIQGHGFKLGRSMLFDSESGQWSISSDVTLDSLFRIQDGIVSIQPAIQVTSKYLEVDVDVEGSLLQEGTMTLTGNNYDHLFVTHWVADLDMTNFILASSTTSAFLFTGSDVTVFVDGDGGGLIELINFLNPDGIARLELEPSVAILVNTASFNSNGFFKGALGILELSLTPSKSYTWEIGYDYQIESMNANGTCNAPITLQSTVPGIAANFRNDPANGGYVTGEYLNIKDINISFGDFEAFNSLNLGNTTGWIINERSGTDLYWVGNSGNWDDPNHWSTSSGGIGGACIPSARDNVFFDNNSFALPDQIVTVNIDDAFCNSMDWTGAIGNATLTSAEKNIHVNGSLTLTDQMIYNLTGDLIFESNEMGNQITSAGNVLNRNIRFTGSGEWILADTLKIQEYLYHEAGTLNTNNQDVFLVDYVSFSDQARKLILGSSTMTLDFIPGNGSEWGASGDLYELDAGTSTIFFANTGSLYVQNGMGLVFNRVIFSSYGNVGNYNNLGQIPPDNQIKYLEMNVWGDVSEYYVLDTLKVLPGSRMNFPNDGSVTVHYLNALGTCDRSISLNTRQSGRTGFIETDATHTDIAYAYIQDLHTTGTGSFEAASSVDLGNNIGWIIDENASRTLYWVGDEGDWQDMTHWSLSSGGPGGQCIPTPNDDVIFDENSFSAADRIVTGSFCHFRNMDWTSIDEPTFIGWDRAYCHGSIYLSPLVEIQYWNVLVLNGDNAGNELDLLGKSLGYGEMSAGSGDWTFISDAAFLSGFSAGGGQIDFGSNVFIMYSFGFFEGGNLNVNLGSAEIHITGEFTTSPPLYCYTNTDPIFDPGTSQIYLEHQNTGLRFTSVAVPLHNVRCTDPEGLARIDIRDYNDIIGRFNTIQFDGDGMMLGETQSDTLIFAPGKSYQLATGKIQHVSKHIQIIGNNCNSIELSSTQVGNFADIEISDFEVVGDFIQMRDIRIGNPMSSYAGIHSTNIANSNQGWIFEDAPSQSSEEQGFFGDDLVLCNNSTIALEAYPFNANATFLWQDGSTDQVLNINTPGKYWARVTFDGSCSIIDTIDIFPQDEFAVVLGNDTTLCNGEQLFLDVSVTGATYLWQDGSTGSNFTVSSQGEYIVDVVLTGCVISDSIIVNYQAFPIVNLGEDRTICENDNTTFDVTNSGASYLWNDGSSMPDFTTNTAGTLFVDVTLNNCTASDTVMVNLTPLALVDIGADTAICEGTLLALTAEVMADSYLWSNGSDMAETSLPEGKHYLDVTLDGCTTSDTILIGSKPYPDFDLGRDTVLCAGETLDFDLTAYGDTFLWQDGSNNPVYQIQIGGLYEVQVGLDGCFTSDDKGTNYLRFPVNDLGADTTLCLGDPFVLKSPTVDITRRLWSDGSTRDSLLVSSSGKYYLDAFNGRCHTSDTIELNFTPKPIFDLGPNVTQCLGDELNIDITVQGASYTWSDGADQPTRALGIADIYWVDVLLDGCTVRDSLELNYVQIPSAALGADTTICEGESVSFDFSNLNLDFEWNDGVFDPGRTISMGGLYWLEVTDRDCSSRDSIDIVITAAPEVDLGRDTMLCLGESIIYNAIPMPEETILWSDGSSENSLTVGATGSYWLEISNPNCTVRDEVLVSFNAPPTFELGMDTLICEQTPLLLRPGISNAQYRWQDGSTNQSFEVNTPGIYTVEIIKNGCSASDAINIETKRCTFYRAFLPEAFSPNGDGANDEYKPEFAPDLQIVSYTMTIYDRWGNQLFMSLDPNIGWDGTFKQKPLTIGTFIYNVAIEYIDDRGPGNRLERGEFLMLK